MEADTVLQRIIAATGMSGEELERRIADKQRELSGLVSREGASYIIAKEYGLELFERPRRRLEIRAVVPGLKNVGLSARVLRVFEPRQFERNGQKSAVANIIIGDGTGSLRLSLWDQQIELLKQLQPGIAVEVFGAYTKDDGRGGTEIRLSKRGGLRVLAESDLPSIERIKEVSSETPQRTELVAVKEGGLFEVRAAVVQLFDSNAFYEVCPSCGGRARKETVTEGPRQYMTFKCAQHGEVTPGQAMVVSGVIDDGTANIRTVWFRDAALALIGMPLEAAVAHKDGLLDNIDVLGKEFVMVGRVKRNKMFGRLEFIVNTVKPVEPKKEAEALINDLQKGG